MMTLFWSAIVVVSPPAAPSLPLYRNIYRLVGQTFNTLFPFHQNLITFRTTATFLFTTYMYGHHPHPIAMSGQHTHETYVVRRMSPSQTVSERPCYCSQCSPRRTEHEGITTIYICATFCTRQIPAAPQHSPPSPRWEYAGCLTMVYRKIVYFLFFLPVQHHLSVVRVCLLQGQVYYSTPSSEMRTTSTVAFSGEDNDGSAILCFTQSNTVSVCS